MSSNILYIFKYPQLSITRIYLTDVLKYYHRSSNYKIKNLSVFLINYLYKY